MTYEQAFKIGSQCDGYVKCTYAVVQNTTKGETFSLQHAGIKNAAREEANETLSAVEEAILTYDIPIIKSNGQTISPDGKWVAGELTNAAREFINRKAKKELFGKGDVTYVRISAIDWIPTNIENASVLVGGIEIQLNSALAEAKKKLEQAKALLATAATATIVL